MEMTCNSEGSGEEGGWKCLGLFEKRQEWAVHESSEEGQCLSTEARNQPEGAEESGFLSRDPLQTGEKVVLRK